MSTLTTRYGWAQRRNAQSPFLVLDRHAESPVCDILATMARNQRRPAFELVVGIPDSVKCLPQSFRLCRSFRE